MSNLFDTFLGDPQEAALPEGGMTFANTGFIGPMVATRYWQFWSPEDLKLYESGHDEGVDYVRRGRTNSYFYYFLDREKGEDAADLVEAFKPRRVWHFKMPVSSVMNARGSLEKFGEHVSCDCRMMTLGSTIYRHEFHLVTLPSLVSALARAAGFIDSPIWHIDEVLGGMSDEDFTDDFQFTMIGDPSASKQDAEKMAAILSATSDLRLAHKIALGMPNVVPPESVASLYGNTKIHYTYSTLALRKAELWMALGEQNPLAYIPAGQASTDAGREYETSATKLVECLGVSTRKWDQPLLVRFHMCKDPRVLATYSEGTKRLSLPVISEVFASTEAAQTAALADARDAPSKVASSKVNPALPVLPERWVTLSEAWIDILSKEKPKTDGMLPDAPGLVALGAQLSATPDDIRAWWDHV